MKQEIRKNYVIDIITVLNTMFQEDYNHDWATITNVQELSSYTTMEIDCSTRYERIALEMMLNSFQGLTVYIKGNTQLEILYHNVE